MRAAIVTELDQQLRNSFWVSVKKFLDRNKFPGNNKISEALKSAFTKQLSGNPVLHFGEILSPSVDEELKQGDAFYVQLFRNNGYINEHTQEKESLHPLTDAAVLIFKDLIRNKEPSENSLVIYSGLKELLQKEIGEQIAVDSGLQDYEKWQLIHDKLETQYSILSSWYKHIPVASIHKEKLKMLVSNNTGLADLAYVRGYGRNNEKEAKNYEESVNGVRETSIVKYLQEVTMGTDQLSLKGDIYFRQRLLQRAGITDWLALLDSLKFPILQDHLFLEIHHLDDYVEIIRGIHSGNNYSTSKEYLLFIALENYFSFVDRTVLDLYSLFYQQKGNQTDSSETNPVVAAEMEYDRWLTKLIPDSFSEILDIIFPDPALERSSYFLDFFEWMNSHSYLYLTHESNAGRIKLIDLLNEIFHGRLKAVPSTKTYLVNNIALDQVNYEALQKMITLFEEDYKDDVYRNKLYELYEQFISSPKFMWFAEGSGNVNFNASLNNAFFFSILLNGYPDNYIKWLSFYKKYRVIHEGWQITPSNSNIYQREAFIFCAGIGMAHHLYQKGDAIKAKSVYEDVLLLLIKQIRACGDTKIIEYITPVKFLALTLGNFDIGEADKFLKLVASRLDKLKYTLVSSYYLFQSAKSTSPLVISDDLKQAIKKKIDTEFWVIEQRKSEAVLAHELNYYKQLRQACLKYLA